VNTLRRLAGPVCLLMATALLSACGIFGDKDDEELEPKELVKFDSTLQIKKVWSTKVGGASEYLLVGLRPVGDGNLIYAASQDGKVVAMDPDSGSPRWKTDLEIELSAGPGVNEGLVAVASKDGEVILLDAATGEEQWRKFIGGETLAHPLIEDDTVVVQTIDNRLLALSRAAGKQRWEIEQTMPLLSMRGASSPLIVGSLVVAGFDNGRLIAVNLETGDIEWDSMLALATGRSDLDRLSDIDGAIAVVGQDVYATGYQGRLSAIAAESGQVLWSREISSYVGVAADWNSVYTARDDGEVIALTRSNGVEIWRNDDLLRREPTLPVPFHTAVVVGDFEGYLHFFSGLSGEPVARVRLGNEAITSDPLVMANRLYVQSDNGTIGAYEVVQNRPKRSAPDISEESDDSESDPVADDS
jgi:outer membrane protein assembly factor BamB